MTDPKQPTWIATYPEREAEYDLRPEPKVGIKQYGKALVARWAICHRCARLVDPLKGERFHCTCGEMLPATEAVVRFWSSDPFRVRDTIARVRGLSPALYQGNWEFSLEQAVKPALTSDMFVLSDGARMALDAMRKDDQ